MEKIYFIQQNQDGCFNLDEINKKIADNYFMVKLIQPHTTFSDNDVHKNGVFIVLDGGSSRLSNNL